MELLYLLIILIFIILVLLLHIHKPSHLYKCKNKIKII